MATRRRTVWLVVLAATGVIASTSAGLAQSQSAPPPTAEFVASLHATQNEHLATALNVVIEPPGGACIGGLQTHSTDQELVVESQSVGVDAVRLASPPPGWGTQDVFLIPHGTTPEGVLFDAPTGDIYTAAMLFTLPSLVQVTKAFAKPATGEAPPEAFRFVGPCVGGDGVSQTPEPLDCGSGAYSADMAMVVAVPGMLLPLAYGVAESAETIFTNCPGGAGMAPGAFVYGEGGEQVTRTDAQLPAADQLFDATVGQITVSGSAAGRYVDVGFLHATQWQWTLTLCRVIDGVPAC